MKKIKTKKNFKFILLAVLIALIILIILFASFNKKQATKKEGLPSIFGKLNFLSYLNNLLMQITGSIQGPEDKPYGYNQTCSTCEELCENSGLIEYIQNCDALCLDKEICDYDFGEEQCVGSENMLCAVMDSNEDHSIMAMGNEDKDFTHQMILKTEKYQKEIAIEWLGKELSNGGRGPRLGGIMIHITINNEEEDAMTFGGGATGYVRISLEGSQVFIDKALKHEVSHAVFRERYLRGIPSWAAEGIASRYDNDPQHITLYRQIATGWISRNSWPDLSRIFILRSNLNNHELYASSLYLVKYLISPSVSQQPLNIRKQTFVKFAVEGNIIGWNNALKKYYNINSVQELQTRWQTWMIKNF